MEKNYIRYKHRVGTIISIFIIAIVLIIIGVIMFLYLNDVLKLEECSKGIVLLVLLFVVQINIFILVFLLLRLDVIGKNMAEEKFKYQELDKYFSSKITEQLLYFKDKKVCNDEDKKTLEKAKEIIDDILKK